MSLLKSKTAKIFVGFVALAMVVTFVAPSQASAQTAEELQAMINSLMAQIAALQNQTGNSSTTGIPSGFQFTSDLTMGSTGASVMNLQKFLNGNGAMVASTGAGSPGNESSYFGALTKAALAKYQAAQGISPAVGYFGPLTRANVNAKLTTTTPPSSGLPAGCTSTSGFSPTTGKSCSGKDSTDTTLKGGAGSISDADYVSKLSNEEVGEGEDDVEVAGLEIEADSGSDIELVAVNLNFSKGTADRDFKRYASEVSVWFEGKELARLPASDFTSSNAYDKTVSLASGAIIRADETKQLVVAVSGVGNLDSGDVSETWTLEFESIRFRDAQNAIVTDSSTGDINDGAGRTFSFEDFATAADVELKVTDGDRSINDSRSITVDDTNDTDGITLFSFKLEAKGNSDILITDMPVTFTSVGAGVGEMVNTVELWFDGKLVGTESVSSTTVTSRVILFDGIDQTIDAGETVDVLVKADFNDLDGGFTSGDTISVAFGETETDLATFDVEDENGDSLVDADKTGSASTEAHVAYDTGIAVAFVSSAQQEMTVDGSDNDYVNLTLVFDITALGDSTIYIPNVDTYMASGTAVANSGNEPSTSQGIGYYLQHLGLSSASASVVEILSSTATQKTNSFEILAGQTKRFTLRSTITNRGANPMDGAQFRLVLTGVNFAITDSATGTNVYTSRLIDNLRTGYGRIAD